MCRCGQCFGCQSPSLCYICGEKDPDAEMCELVEITDFSIEERQFLKGGAYLVHAQCGIDAGWETA